MNDRIDKMCLLIMCLAVFIYLFSAEETPLMTWSMRAGLAAIGIMILKTFYEFFTLFKKIDIPMCKGGRNEKPIGPRPDPPKAEKVSKYKCYDCLWNKEDSVCARCEDYNQWEPKRS